MDQSEFARALSDGGLPPPSGMHTWNGSDPAHRFGIHRNNSVVSLIDALATKFPVVGQLVGDEFFRAMARRFVIANPPDSPLLAEYGDAFPAFLAGFAPAKEFPYLADVAALEAARVRAYHAADALALDRHDFAHIDPSSLADVTFRLHPSAEILTSRFAIVALWDAHQGRRDIGTVDPFDREDALVVRPGLTVEVTLLPPGLAVFLQRLRREECLADAAEAAMEVTSQFRLLEAFHILVATRVVVGYAHSNGAAK